MVCTCQPYVQHTERTNSDDKDSTSPVR
ncbi:unnamed protein product, partial [Rotaria sp. Silwood1]